MKYPYEINTRVNQTVTEYSAKEVVKLRDGRVMNTIVKKILIEHEGKKNILVVRIDTTDRQRVKMASKILSASLPSLKAYLWYIDSRNNILKYNNVYIKTERVLEDMNTLEIGRASCRERVCQYV